MYKYILAGISFSLFLMASTMADAHVENFNGVDINFSYPNLAEKQTFKLRGVLNKAETEIVASAIPTIAKFLNFIGRTDLKNFSEKINEPRKPYQYINEKKVWLAPINTHKWRVSENSISFVADFIVNYGKIGSGTMGDYLFRDAYTFKKINGNWFFYENYGDKPYGFLKCKRTDEKCTLDTDLW